MSRPQSPGIKKTRKLSGARSPGASLRPEVARRPSTLGRQVGDGHLSVSLESNHSDTDERAFNELQNYADFQQSLSNSLLDGIARGGRPPMDPSSPLLTASNWNNVTFSRAPTNQTAPSTASNIPLSKPVVIPQDFESPRCNWKRAYAPLLQGSGISQSCFLHFLDLFNRSDVSLPFVEAINLASLGANTASEAIPVALRLSKSRNGERQTFLGRANADVFEKLHLFAMIVTCRPDDRSQVFIWESMESYWQPTLLDDPSRTAFQGLESLETAPIVFFPSNWPQQNEPETFWGFDGPGRREPISDTSYQFQSEIDPALELSTIDFNTPTGSGTTAGSYVDPGMASQTGEVLRMKEGELYLMIVNNLGVSESNWPQETNLGGSAAGEDNYLEPTLFF